MDKRPKYPDIQHQTRFWNQWNTSAREGRPLDPPTERRSSYVQALCKSLSTGGPIIDIGCGTGWLCDRLSQFAPVYGTDLAADVIKRAQQKYPKITFSGGDFMALDFPQEHFEIAVCMETIAHVPDQSAFLKKVGGLLRPGGRLILTTQNPFVWNRSSILGPPGDGQIRNWPSKKQLVKLVAEHLVVENVTTLAPGGDQGILKLINGRLISGGGRRLIGRANLNLLKERIGIGQSIAIIAVKPK